MNQEDIFDTLEKKTKAGRERAGASGRIPIDLAKVQYYIIMLFTMYF